MIEATLSLTRQASLRPPPVSGRWSFYTLLFPSSTCAREVRVRHRLKSFDREAVHDADAWRAMAGVCASKGMVATAVRCVG